MSGNPRKGFGGVLCPEFVLRVRTKRVCLGTTVECALLFQVPSKKRLAALARYTEVQLKDGRDPRVTVFEVRTRTFDSTTNVKIS